VGTQGKSKGHQKGEVGRLLKTVKEEWKEFRKNVVKGSEDFQKQWADKFNDLNDRFKKLTIGMAQQLAGMGANQQIHSDVIEKLDINIQVISKMMKDIYGRIGQVDVVMERSDIEFDLEMSNMELEAIKAARDTLFQDVMTESFRIVHEERKASIEQRRKEAEKAAEEAEEAKEAQAEAIEVSESEGAQKALEEAERPTLIKEPGGPGEVEIPEGAEVFGG
jgi:hypothetical protein